MNIEEKFPKLNKMYLEVMAKVLKEKENLQEGDPRLEMIEEMLQEEETEQIFINTIKNKAEKVIEYDIPQIE